MSSLAGKLFCDDSNVTGIVDRLEARGLIERRREHDRRVKLLGLPRAELRVAATEARPPPRRSPLRSSSSAPRALRAACAAPADLKRRASPGAR